MVVIVDIFLMRSYVYPQPRLFVGRGMHEGAFSLFKYVKLLPHTRVLPIPVTNSCPARYTMFWVLLLAMKLIVSFYVEVNINFLYSLSLCSEIVF
jgi:hypothetical protein